MGPITGPIAVGPLQRHHGPHAAALVGELGYPVPAADVFMSRVAGLAVHPQQQVLVAEGPQLAGWLHVLGVRRLDSDGYAEVLTLVVAGAYRRRGVGRRLMMAAEQWAREQGFARIRLRSGLHRADAHAFYESLGYAVARPGHTFQKSL